MVDGSDGASRTVLLSLFWALQGSLLSWCYLQFKGDTTEITMDLARDILLKCETALMLHNTNELLVTFLCLEEHVACCLSADCDGPSDQKICDHEVDKRSEGLSGLFL